MQLGAGGVFALVGHRTPPAQVAEGDKQEWDAATKCR